MSAPERLYGLLPAIYRIRDAERGEPLRALLGILEEQLELLEGDVGGLYDDHFIETCEEWVVPYVGDLLGVRLLHNVESGGLVSQRALVANTLSFRRRKGTLSMLEDLARDVTGWRAKAVAFFELLGWSQNLNHLRFDFTPNPDPREPDRLNPPAADRVGTVNLRHLDAVDRLEGPFDVLAHTVDVRPLGQLEGWHNIRKLGLFLWRLGSYPMPGVEPRPSAPASTSAPWATRRRSLPTPSARPTRRASPPSTTCPGRSGRWPSPAAPPTTTGRSRTSRSPSTKDPRSTRRG